MARRVVLPLVLASSARECAALSTESAVASGWARQQSKWALPSQGFGQAALGYPIALPLMDSETYAAKQKEGAQSKQEGLKALREAGRHSSHPLEEPRTVPRLIMYDVQDHAGLDDRIFVMMHMLSFATVVQASLAFPAPSQLLGRKHGDSLAGWWDEYYFTDPPIHRFQDVACSPNIPETVVTHPQLVDALDEDTYAALMDQTQPLCLRIKIKYYAMIRGGKTELLINMGIPNVRIWTSQKVARIMEEVIREVPEFNNDYNVAHVRLGDKSQSCVTAANVEHAILNLTNAHPQGGLTKPWLVMSDGDRSFFKKLMIRANRDNLHLITESDVKVLSELQDNYLRYTVLSCFCGGADLQLWNYKQIGGRCNLKRSQSVASARFACRDSGEAFVRDEWGPQSKLMA